MWRLALLLSLCVGAATAAENTAPFPLGVYWPWERLLGHAERLGMDKWQLVEQRLADLQSHSVDSVWIVNLNIADLGPLAGKWLRGRST